MGKYVLLAVAVCTLCFPLGGNAANSEDKATTLSASVDAANLWPYANKKPVSDEVFASYRASSDYDRTDLNAVVEPVPDDSEIWRREKVWFDAAYDGERVPAHLFLPKGVSPPYQVVVFCPGGGALVAKSFEKFLATAQFSPASAAGLIVREGRALMVPIYNGTFERARDRSAGPLGTDGIRDAGVKMVKDLRRAVDYLQSRDDIDPNRIAYAGNSWGGSLGPFFLALEDRFKAGLLFFTGLTADPSSEGLNPFNYAVRVKAPVLMINGREDAAYPYDVSQKPLYNAWGTPTRHKRHFTFPGGHAAPSSHIGEIRGEVAAWLDRYLGPVARSKGRIPQVAFGRTSARGRSASHGLDIAVSVIFDSPVTGVAAGDLAVDGSPAKSLDDGLGGRLRAPARTCLRDSGSLPDRPVPSRWP